MLPYVIAGGAVVANGVKDVVIKLVDGEVLKNYTDVVENINNIQDNAFHQQYLSKRLALELSKNYTTSTKDLDGSIIPSSFSTSNGRSNQIERLIQSTLNQVKFRG